MHLFMGSAPGTRRMDQPETLQSEEDRRRPQDGDRRRGDQRSPEEDRRRTAEERSPEEDRKRSPEEDRRRRAEEERCPEEQRRRSPEEERSRLIHVKAYQGQTSRAGGPMLDGSPEHSSTIKRQRYGSRLGGVKVRHRRQALQDMARPLKHWLYKHRDNPYPTKTQKLLLALGSHMTLVQVSNWFANARRRLKNTVRRPDLSWALRIKLYNQCIQGNAEKLSVCSDDSGDEECPLETAASQQCDISRSPSLRQEEEEEDRLLRRADSLRQEEEEEEEEERLLRRADSLRQEEEEEEDRLLRRADSPHSDGSLSPPPKYKSGLLHRYLSDRRRHAGGPCPAAAAAAAAAPARRARSRLEESFSSAEGEQHARSPTGSSEMETEFVYHMDAAGCASPQRDLEQRRGQQEREGWGEINAAMALTHLAQGPQMCLSPSSPGRSGTRGPTSTAMTNSVGKACTLGPTGSPWQSCTVGSIISVGNTLTRRIIQKSSHISEIQTVKLALANSL